jgi:ABC-type nitrate/sulfonate/bicarbonate transport system substrate-binding protein
LDWAKDIAAAASMRDSASSPVKKLLPADIRSLKAYLKSLKGSKVLAVEETSTSHWLYVELFATVGVPERSEGHQQLTLINFTYQCFLYLYQLHFSVFSLP